VNAYQLIDGLSLAFFALLAMWAAVVRRHWFLRFAVVSGCLLAALFIPAYEVVIEFGLMVSIILAGVWLARGGTLKPRMSLETALLAMVVVAVVAAVAARLPDLALATWIELITVGISGGLLAILLLWISAGQASKKVRAIWGSVGLLIVFALYHFGKTASNATHSWQGGNNWLEHFVRSYRSDFILGWLLDQLPAIGITCVVCLAAIALARASGWFTVIPRSSEDPTFSAALARCALVGLAALVVTPLLMLFYRLLTPPPIPAPVLTSPNGFDDLVAAGRMVPAGITTPQQVFGNANSPAPNETQLAAELLSLQPVFDQIDKGLSREVAADLRTFVGTPNQSDLDRDALRAAEQALWLRYAQKRRFGNTAEQADAAFRILEFVQKAYHGAGIKWFEYSLSSQTPEFVVGELRLLLPRADARQCREYALRLYELDQACESLDEQGKVEALLDSQSGWNSHAGIILDEWSGFDTYKWFGDDRKRREAERRAVVLEFALRAYCLEHHRLPHHLDALRPEILPGIPDDPYGLGPMKMKHATDGVAVYGVGLDGDDDGGTPHRVDAAGRVYVNENDVVYPMSAKMLGLEQE
jgi:hypothetical protein